MPAFDIDTLRRGHAEHDAATLTSLYADDAVIEVVDASRPPSQPLRIEGTEQIRAFFDDLCSRDMTHEVADAFTDGEHLAFRVACQYSSGERVLSSEMCDLRDGHIIRETLVQAWDS